MKRRFYKLLCKVGYGFNQSILYLDDETKNYYLRQYNCKSVRQLEDFLWKNFKIIVIEK